MAYGDLNTHRKASSWRKKNQILAISDEEGNISGAFTDIQNAFISHYQNLWQEDWAWGPLEADLSEPSITELEALQLTRPVEEAEIFKAMRSLPLGKAPGIDGVGASFYRAYWSIIKKEVIEAVQRFFSLSFMPPSWKKTIIALIPKNDSPSLVTDYRPISLCSFTYKLCTKINNGE